MVLKRSLLVALVLVLAGCGPAPAPTAATAARTPRPTAKESPVPSACTAVGQTRVRAADGMEMVCVPEAEFLMGSSDADPDAGDDEKPQHTVYLDGYWIDRTEVTNAQYRKCVEAGACQAPTTCDWGEPTYGDTSKANHPVVCVDWYRAQAYCAWAGGQLPTEAQWEKAARGVEGRIYPWGNAFDCARGNFDDETQIDSYVVPGGAGCDGYDGTAPVGSFPSGASPYGALDMAGNVWEWLADWYDSGYYAQSPSRNPSGPASGDIKVLRGGSWLYVVWYARAAARDSGAPDHRYDVVGFRCVVAPGR